MKICTKCDQQKELLEFPQRSHNGKYRNECKVCTAKYKKTRCEINREHILAAKKKYREDPKNKKHRREWDKKKRKSSTNHKLRINLRTRLNKALNKNYKSGSAVKDLGCSIEEFKLYMESKFYPHSETKKIMTWDNHGNKGWHIDHIKPLASFDLANREQFLEACHYTNLQPLWAEDNLKKGKKWHE